MAAYQIGNLESTLFQTSGEPKALAERLMGERIISWERAPIDHEYFGPASEILTEIDEENIRQPTEEKVYQITFRLMGMDYIADPEKREQLFLDNPELHKEFSEKYWVAGQAVNFKMGGTAYETKPSEVVIERGKPKKSGALLYIGLALGGLATAAAGFLLGDVDGDGVSGKDELFRYHTNPFKHDPALKYVQRVKNLIRYDVKEYYTKEEIRDIQDNLMDSLLNDGIVSDDEINALESLEKSRRWWVTRDIINSGMIDSGKLHENWDGDLKEDGTPLTNYEEMLQGTNPLNRLETDPSDLSERYTAILAVAGYIKNPMEVESINGITELLKKNGYNDYNVHLVHDPGKNQMEMIKEYPIKVDYIGPAHERATAEEFLNHIKNLRSDENDTVYIYVSCHGNVNKLYMGGDVYIEEFNRILNQMESGEAIVTINASMSGAFIKQVNYPNMTIISTNSETESANIPINVFLESLDSGLSVRESFDKFEYQQKSWQEPGTHHPVMYSSMNGVEPINPLVYRKLDG